MLDLDRLRKIRLHRTPKGQVAFAQGFLRWDYLLPHRTDIVLEGLQNLPTDRRVFFAMNHTDRYNYWPFQYQMYRQGFPFTATWVKGKYYKNPLVARFLDSCNNIPLPSRGYVITTEFQLSQGRAPHGEEYRLLRDVVDGRIDEKESRIHASAEVRRFIDESNSEGHSLAAHIEEVFSSMMREVVRLTREALEVHGNNVLVFPQGTRSKRLPRGHTGLAQMAQHLGTDIVPVGCNGTDHAYPTSSPFSKGGRVVYRIGAPLSPEGSELSDLRITAPFEPFSHAASTEHGEALQEITDVVMRKINELLDAEYQFSDDLGSDGVEGMGRFV